MNITTRAVADEKSLLASICPVPTLVTEGRRKSGQADPSGVAVLSMGGIGKPRRYQVRLGGAGYVLGASFPLARGYPLGLDRRSMGSSEVEEGARAAAAAERFDDLLGRLRALVERLESGNLPLEDSLKSFEEGMALCKRGADVLDRAEKRVELLLAGGDGRTALLDTAAPEAAAGEAGRTGPHRGRDL